MSNIIHSGNGLVWTPGVQALGNAGFNLIELIRNNSRKLLWSRGYTLKGTDPKLIAKVMENTRAEIIFGKVHHLLFEQGYCIVTIRRTVSGELYLTAPILWGASNVAQVFDNEELAVIWGMIQNSLWP